MTQRGEGADRRIGRGAVPHPVWHLALILAGLAVVGVFFMDPEQAVDERTIAQLRVARVGLMVAAGGLVGLWLLRGMLEGDLAAVLKRWREAPATLPRALLVPALEPAALRWLASAAALLWAIAVAIGVSRRSAWVERLTWENGPLETITVISYLAACAFALCALWPYVKRGFRAGETRRWFLLAAAAGCFLIAAEETDWGQTYFQYQTPETFEHANIQSDLSLHNLALPESFGVTRWANWTLGVMAVALGGGVALLLFTCAPFRRLVWALEAPLPPYWSQVVLFLAVWIPEVEGQFRRNNIGSELREVTIAVAVCLWLWTTWRSAVRAAANGG